MQRLRTPCNSRFGDLSTLYRFDLLIALVVMSLCIGCAKDVAGSWETVDVRPAGASFPFNRIQFGAGNFTALGMYDGSGRMSDEPQTTTGDFRRKGSSLEILPHKGDPQRYTMRRRLDGKLEIVMKSPGQKPLTAVLAPGGGD